MKREKRDITNDFLRCNRCGACKAVCPVFEVKKEEWASARGKVELAEAFFRGEDVDLGRINEIYDLCLQCRTCEENCPSGMRADDIIMAVRKEMAAAGRIPRVKRAALKLLDGMDNILFRSMRALGLAGRSPLHGVGGKSPLSIFYPLLGWPRQRFVPLPRSKPFIGNNPEFFPASEAQDLPTAGRWDGRQALLDSGMYDGEKVKEFLERFSSAREKNLEAGTRVYLYIGHAINHFFPEEARDMVRVLNLAGVDVLVPADQVCCGAPVYYAGDIEGARKAAAKAIESFSGKEYDWIVTSCASGGLMLREEFPKLFGIHEDAFFDIIWDPVTEVFLRSEGEGLLDEEFIEIPDLYRRNIEGRVKDVNELLAGLLGFEEQPRGLDSLLSGEPVDETHGGSGKTAVDNKEDPRPIVTYHHPCHLNRGQGVSWQPVKLLESLPGYQYVEMDEADRCCGGGGSFTFTNAAVSQEIARKKIDSIEAAGADIVSTSCPVCKIQLIDMLRRRFVLEARKEGRETSKIPVISPVELIAGELERILEE